MRIIITEKGEEVLKNVREEKEINKNAKKEFNKINVRKSNPEIRNRNFLVDIRMTKLPIIHDSRNFSQNHNTKVKVKKVFIPRQIIDKYNSQILDVSDGKKIDSIIEDKSSWNRAKSIDGNLKDIYSLKEIIPQKVCTNLKLSMQLKNKMKNESSVLNNFRSKYHQNLSSVIDGELNKEISAEKTNLIRYLNQKDSISELLLKKLNDCNETQINKLNRVCQKIFKNRENSLVFNEKMKKIINENKSKEDTDFQNKLSLMESEIRGIKSIINIDRRPYNERDRYLDRHVEFEKVWQKKKLDKLVGQAKKISNRETSFISRKSLDTSMNNVTMLKSILSELSED